MDPQIVWIAYRAGLAICKKENHYSKKIEKLHMLGKLNEEHVKDAFMLLLDIEPKDEETLHSLILSMVVSFCKENLELLCILAVEFKIDVLNQAEDEIIRIIPEISDKPCSVEMSNRVVDLLMNGEIVTTSRRLVKLNLVDGVRIAKLRNGNPYIRYIIDTTQTVSCAYSTTTTVNLSIVDDPKYRYRTMRILQPDWSAEQRPVASDNELQLAADVICTICKTYGKQQNAVLDSIDWDDAVRCLMLPNLAPFNSSLHMQMTVGTKYSSLRSFVTLNFDKFLPLVLDRLYTDGASCLYFFIHEFHATEISTTAGQSIATNIFHNVLQYFSRRGTSAQTAVRVYAIFLALAVPVFSPGLANYLQAVIKTFRPSVFLNDTIWSTSAEVVFNQIVLGREAKIINPMIHPGVILRLCSNNCHISAVSLGVLQSRLLKWILRMSYEETDPDPEIIGYRNMCGQIWINHVQNESTRLDNIEQCTATTLLIADHIVYIMSLLFVENPNSVDVMTLMDTITKNPEKSHLTIIDVLKDAMIFCRGIISPALADTPMVEQECMACLHVVPCRTIRCTAGHFMCPECAKKWFEKHNTCPMCRETIPYLEV